MARKRMTTVQRSIERSTVFDAMKNPHIYDNVLIYEPDIVAAKVRRDAKDKQIKESRFQDLWEAMKAETKKLSINN